MPPQSLPSLTDPHSVTHHFDDPQDLSQYHQLYALRSHLAGFAARHAALRVGDGVDSSPLADRLRSMHSHAATRDFDGFLAADMLFHRTIAEMADTPALVEIWTVLEERFRAFAAWSHRALFADLAMIADAHQTQYDTIASGAPAAAEHAAHVDLDALWQMLTETPAQFGGEVDPVERVRAYAILNLHRRLTLAGVARDVAYLSPSHLARLFRAGRQESFTNFVQGLRLRRAASLLESTDLSVQYISDRVGYGDISRFTLHFRRLFGSTPSEWRKEKVAKRR